VQGDGERPPRGDEKHKGEMMISPNQIKSNQIKYNRENRRGWSLLVDRTILAVFSGILPSLPDTTPFRPGRRDLTSSKHNLGDSDSDDLKAPPSNGVTVANVTDKGVLNVVLDQKRAPTQHRYELTAFGVSHTHHRSKFPL